MRLEAQSGVQAFANDAWTTPSAQERLEKVHLAENACHWCSRFHVAGLRSTRGGRNEFDLGHPPPLRAPTHRELD
jgi:hypothetical protein